MTECVVSDILYDSQGVILAGATLTFTRIGKIVGVDGDKLVVPVFGDAQAGSKSVTTDATTAEFSISLVWGVYELAYQGRAGAESVTFVVTAQEAATLRSLIDQATTIDSTLVQQAVAARDAALQYAAEAEADRVLAQVAAAAAGAATPTPGFSTVAEMAAATENLAIGNIVEIAQGYNGAGEMFRIVPSGTFTANGAEVVALAISGVQAVSTRMWFTSFADFIADTRTHSTGARLSILGIGEYQAVASSGNLGQANAGGQEFDALPGVDGWYSAAALNLTDGNDAASRLAAFVAAGLHKIRVPRGQSVAIDTLCTIDAQGIDLELDGYFDCSGGGRISIEGAHSALPALASTVTKGVAKTFTFASAHGLAVGDHVCFWDETDFSAGLARYYYRQGWRALVATVPTSTTATFFGTLPIDLDHTVMNCAKVTGERVTLPATCRFTPAPGDTNPVVQVARQKFVEVRARVDNGAAHQAIAVTQCYNVVSGDPAATVVDGDAYPINISCCGGGRLESVALFSGRHAEAIGGGGAFDSFAGNTPMRDFIVVNSTLRSSGLVGAADAHGATFGCRFVNCIMDAGWALGGGDNVGVDCTIICTGEFGLRMTEVDGGVIRLENPHFITYGAQSEGTIYLFPGFLSRDLTLIVNNPTFEHRGGATDQVRPFAIHALSTNDWDVSAGAPPSPSHVKVYKVTVGGTYDGHTYSVDDLAIYTSYGPSGGKVVPIAEHSVDVVVTAPKVVGTLTSVTFAIILGTRDVSALYSFSMDDISGPGGALFFCSEAANYNMPLRLPRQTVRGTLSLTTAGTSAITGLLNFPWSYPTGREPDCAASWHLSATGSMTAAQEEVEAAVWARTGTYARVSLRREGGAAFGSNYDAVVSLTARVDDL